MLLFRHFLVFVSLPLPGTRLRVCKNTGHGTTHQVMLTLLAWHAASWLPSSESVCLHGLEPLVSWDMPEAALGLLAACFFVLSLAA